jgi:hypothetical protein
MWILDLLRLYNFSPVTTVACGNTSPEDSDGLYTCSVGTFVFTTFTPSGGPGNDCGASTMVPQGDRNFGGVQGEIPISAASQEEEGDGLFTITPRSVVSAQGSLWTIAARAEPTGPVLESRRLSRKKRDFY